jgi:hypothetical protein
MTSTPAESGQQQVTRHSCRRRDSDITPPLQRTGPSGRLPLEGRSWCRPLNGCHVISPWQLEQTPPSKPLTPIRHLGQFAQSLTVCPSNIITDLRSYLSSSGRQPTRSTSLAKCLGQALSLLGCEMSKAFVASVTPSVWNGTRRTPSRLVLHSFSSSSSRIGSTW